MKRLVPVVWRVLTLLSILAATLPEAFAVTAFPGLFSFRQPDGSSVTLMAFGDEWIHGVKTADGYTVLQNAKGGYVYARSDQAGDMVFTDILAHDSAGRPLQESSFLKTIRTGLFFSDAQLRSMKSRLADPGSPTPSLTGSFPATGTRKLIMILANFSNTSTTYTQGDFQAFMNQPGYSGSGSFRDYYMEVSYGKLVINTTVTVWVTLPNSHDYYGPRSKWGEFALAAITAADQQASVNFAEFDNDANGIVDGIAIIHQGHGQEETHDTNDIWSHSSSLSNAAWGFTPAQRTFDGVLVDAYTTQPEQVASGMCTIGVMCHEFCHNLGAPDFYDTDYETGGQYDGTGKWDLMAQGSWNGINGNLPAHPNGWIKSYLGWTTPAILSNQQVVCLRNVQAYPDATVYRTATQGEYFLCENRQKTGFDAGLPGHGLVIYHVDSSFMAAHMTDNTINAGAHQGLYPVCANATGNPVVTYGVINSDGCSFPGSGSKFEFTDNTIPNARSWSGAGTLHPLVNIFENASSREVTFIFGDATSQFLQRGEYFIDMDPGAGNGTPLAFSSGPLATTEFNLPLGDLSCCIHSLYIRARSTGGQWGMVQAQPFYRLKSELPIPVCLEYFFDTDPGIGQGIPIPLSSGINPVTESLNIPITAVSSGIHSLFIRGKDQYQRWGIVQTAVFYKVETTGYPVSGFEYFIDTDPGTGQGMTATVPGISGSNASSSFLVDLSETAPGIHTLYIRTRNTGHQWSITSRIPFYRAESHDQRVISKLEFFLDTDPGHGAGLPVPVYQPFSWFDQTFTVDLSCYPAGSHRLYLRTADDAGRWGLTTSQPVSVTISAPVIRVMGSLPLTQGQSVLLKVPKGIGRSYEWLRNGMALSGANDSTLETSVAGSYRAVIHHQNLCTDTTAPVEITIQFPAQLTLAGIALQPGDEACYGALQTILVAGDGSVFTVNNGASATLVSGQNIVLRPSVQVKAGGFLHAYIAPSGPFCQGPSSPYTAHTTSGQYDPATSASAYRIWPNPTNGRISIAWTNPQGDETWTIAVFNSMWKRIREAEGIGAGPATISLDDCLPGLYIVRITRNNQIMTGKIIRL
ncbi:MAG TPA: M6 family metalloprotease domain-containing protein [Bacteroidales bacterium]|nr:M6 family metalloprotease domain-containing protein [Bacteroidales bacterium]